MGRTDGGWLGRRPVLAVTADAAYVDQARQVLLGAQRHGGWPGDYLLLTDRVPAADERWFADRGVHVQRAAPAFANDHLPAVTFSRYALFREEVRRWSFVLFLDLDMIVRGGLSGLLELDRLGAVRGYKSTVRGNFVREKDPALYDRLDREFDLDRPAFNGGTLAFPTDILDATTHDRLCELTARYLPISRFANQGLLNLMFLGNWTELPPQYNAYAPTYVSRTGELVLRDARIIHFNGRSMKPWDRESPTFATFGEEWRANLAAARLGFRASRAGSTTAPPMARPARSAGW